MPGVKELLKESGVALLDQIEERLEPLPALQARIESAIVDDPPVSIRDGGMIREGYHDGLDELREIARDGKSYITGIKNKLEIGRASCRERVQITVLGVGLKYN